MFLESLDSGLRSASSRLSMIQFANQSANDWANYMSCRAKILKLFPPSHASELVSVSSLEMKMIRELRTSKTNSSVGWVQLASRGVHRWSTATRWVTQFPPESLSRLQFFTVKFEDPMSRRCFADCRQRGTRRIITVTNCAVQKPLQRCAK